MFLLHGILDWTTLIFTWDKYERIVYNLFCHQFFVWCHFRKWLIKAGKSKLVPLINFLLKGDHDVIYCVLDCIWICDLSSADIAWVYIYIVQVIVSLMNRWHLWQMRLKDTEKLWVDIILIMVMQHFNNCIKHKET